MFEHVLEYQSATLSGEAFRQMKLHDEDHNTILHLAAQRGHMAMIVRVVNEGMSLEACDQQLCAIFLVCLHEVFGSERLCSACRRRICTEKRQKIWPL